MFSHLCGGARAPRPTEHVCHHRNHSYCKCPVGRTPSGAQVPPRSAVRAQRETTAGVAAAGRLRKPLRQYPANPHPMFQLRLKRQTIANVQRTRIKLGKSAPSRFRRPPHFGQISPHRGNFWPQSAFSFGPCTARFLFGATEKKMGGAFPSAATRRNPIPARQGGPPNFQFLIRKGGAVCSEAFT